MVKLECDFIFKIMKQVKVEEHRWDYVCDSIWTTLEEAEERHKELAKENVVAFVKPV